jgi:hypothetical protein
MNEETIQIEREEDGVRTLTFINKEKPLTSLIKMASSETNQRLRILEMLRTVDAEENDIVKADFIIAKLNLSGKDAKEVEVLFESIKFVYSDLNEEIEKWSKAGVTFEIAKRDNTEIIDELSDIEIDATKGMCRIMHPSDWGNKGGVFVNKVVASNERNTTLNVVLKYLKDDSYICSEVIKFKISDLKCNYEMDNIFNSAKKMKVILDYMPPGKEQINYVKLYYILCKLHHNIKENEVVSNKSSLSEVYAMIVEQAYKLNDIGIGAVGSGMYILSKEELAGIANSGGYKLGELVSLLSDNRLLESDKDNPKRKQKTMRRNKENKKYYCILDAATYEERNLKGEDIYEISEEAIAKECKKLKELTKREYSKRCIVPEFDWEVE